MGEIAGRNRLEIRFLGREVVRKVRYRLGRVMVIFYGVRCFLIGRFGLSLRF